MIKCLHCGAETSNGLALCETCRVAVSVYLEFFPVYFRNLARWRPGRAGSRPVPGSREPQGLSLAPPDRVMRALDAAGNALSTWARTLEQDRGITAPLADDEAEQVAALCRWLAENLTSISTLDWCGEFMRTDYPKGAEGDGLGFHERALRNLTEDVIPGWYAGGCKRCGSGTYVVPGLTWVTCGGCGTTTYARDHLETILDEARGWVARPKAIAGALVALVDTELSVPRLHDRIRQWSSRGTLDPIREDQYAIKRYRFGAVLDVLSAEGATRTSNDVVAESTTTATLVTSSSGGSVPECA